MCIRCNDGYGWSYEARWPDLCKARAAQGKRCGRGEYVDVLPVCRNSGTTVYMLAPVDCQAPEVDSDERITGIVSYAPVGC